VVGLSSAPVANPTGCASVGKELCFVSANISLLVIITAMMPLLALTEIEKMHLI